MPQNQQSVGEPIGRKIKSRLTASRVPTLGPGDHTDPGCQGLQLRVRKKTNGVFHPVKLECAGGNGEITDWRPLDGPDGDYEFAWVELTAGFTAQKLTTGECGYGRQAAQSEGVFGITVWGWAKDASYGYAGGMGARPINDAPLPIVQ